MISIVKKTISGLSKTRNKINKFLIGLSGKSKLDDDDLEELEELLLRADLGWELTENIINELKLAYKKESSLSERFIIVILEYLHSMSSMKELQKIILLVGINGTGKTTSAAKLGGYFAQKGEVVSLVAADTYRAAAVEQIKIWSNRLNLHLISNEKSMDPASVAYDGVSSGIAKNHDRIIIDTSGRVHTSANLMKELEKMYNVVTKLSSEVDVLMTIDANTGQNGLQQVKEFSKYIPISGIILTKMDGTARGGIALQIMKELDIHVYFMGIGEAANDLVPFEKESYVRALIHENVESLNV